VTVGVRALLSAYDLEPRKRLGQNFLVEPAALSRIVAAANLSDTDVVVEAGAGLGTLTRPLAERAGRVVAVELDERLVEILRVQVADLGNVEIVHGDILSVAELAGLALPHLGFKVVGNLPYYITSAILRRFLAREPRPSMMVVTVQREVAQRIVAEPGKMSLLAVSVQWYGRPQIVARIPAGAFYPKPTVDSAVVRIDTGERTPVALEAGLDETLLFRVAKAGFAQRRKMLRNSLAAGLRLPTSLVEGALQEMGVDPRRRAQTLSLEEWAAVTQTLSPMLHA
jgi:16S rRNA (adenine1518-N6/adenine1519-N6)-dimethyltransferase